MTQFTIFTCCIFTDITGFITVTDSGSRRWSVDGARFCEPLWMCWNFSFWRSADCLVRFRNKHLLVRIRKIRKSCWFQLKHSPASCSRVFSYFHASKCWNTVLNSGLWLGDRSVDMIFIKSLQVLVSLELKLLFSPKSRRENVERVSCENWIHWLILVDFSGLNIVWTIWENRSKQLNKNITKV